MPPNSPNGVCENCKGPSCGPGFYYCEICRELCGTKREKFLERFREYKGDGIHPMDPIERDPLEFELKEPKVGRLTSKPKKTKEIAPVKELDFSDWQHAKTALELFDRVFIDGPPGVGKSSWAKTELRNSNTPFEEITLNGDIMAQEILGYKTYGEGFKLEFEAGPVARAVKNLRDNGAAGLIINEIGRASGAVLDFMLHVLDDSLDAAVTLPGGESYALTGLKIIGTSNSTLADCDPALGDRFPVKVHVDIPSPYYFAFLRDKHEILAAATEKSYLDNVRPLNARKIAAAVRAIGRGHELQTVMNSVLGPAAAQELLMEIKLS